MQDIQDKDFNEIFRQKFESFEVEPTSAVWRGIASELDNNKRKKPFPVFWLMTAASVLIVFSTGLWLFSPKEKIRLRGKTEVIVLQDELPDNTVSASIVKEAGKWLKSEETILANTSGFVVTGSLKLFAEEQKVAEVAALASIEAPVKEIELTKMDNTVLKDEKTYSVMDQPVPAFASDQVSVSDTKKYAVLQPRIKTVGDLINFVVGKVDPREDKIIQFSARERH